MLFRRLQLFEIAHLAGNFSARMRGCCRRRERNAFLGETPAHTRPRNIARINYNCDAHHYKFKVRNYMSARERHPLETAL
jgi:hypothetical protein